MTSFFEHLKQKWNNWVGDRDLEIAIRRHLSDNGYFGRTAKLRNVRLVAVKRPGWIQVHRFEVTARVNRERVNRAPADTGEDYEADDLDQPAQYTELLGLVRDDTRDNLNLVRTFTDESQRREIFRQWSEDLICLRGAQGLLGD